MLGEKLLIQPRKVNSRLNKLWSMKSQREKSEGKTYKGLVNGFPGQMRTKVFEFLSDKASSSNKGFDPVTAIIIRS